VGELVRGTVRDWFAEEGWGVIDSPATPGGCFTHFSAIQMDGYRQLTPGQTVWIDPRQPGQDGCAWTTSLVRLDGTVHDTPRPNWGYRSTLTIDFDVDPCDQRWEVDRPTYRFALWSANGAVSWHQLDGLYVGEVLAWAAERALGGQAVVYVVHRDHNGLGLIRLAGTDPSATDAAPVVFLRADVASPG
jgi:CspA family cold shock protein